MRRALMVSTWAAAAVVLVASVSAAAEPIVGTEGPDRLAGGNGPDLIQGLGGDDRLNGNHGPDVADGGPGNDVIWTGKGGPGDEAYGGPGNDRLNNWSSGSAPGLLDGGDGRDVCIGDKHDTFVSCEVIRFD
jgi:Ca2+-binding RTX toxin-like protein